MNISRVGFNTVNFGSIKKSAVEKAIKQANGEVSELERIKELIEEQKDNQRYDIKGLGPGEYYNYIVIKRGEHSGQCYMKLSEASDSATRSNKSDAAEEEREAKKSQQQPEFERLASEILAECEE